MHRISRINPKLQKNRPQRELAELISKVVTHPLVPVEIYNAIVDEIGFLGGDLSAFYDGPDFIEMALEAAAEELEASDEK